MNNKVDLPVHHHLLQDVDKSVEDWLYQDIWNKMMPHDSWSFNNVIKQALYGYVKTR